MTHSPRLVLDPARLPTCCAAIAGVLAEHAITRLTLQPASGTPRPLHARETDLPGELLRSLPCTLRTEPPTQLELHLTTAAIEWTTDDEALAESLGKSLARALS